jgi:coenzyme Q-binding protein COQ10
LLFIKIIINILKNLCLNHSTQKTYNSPRKIFAMITYHTHLKVDFSAKQIFDLVLDVNNYKNFLPWIHKSLVTKEGTDFLEAQLSIGYSGIEKNYKSLVKYFLSSDNTSLNDQLNMLPINEKENFFGAIITKAEKGIFKTLDNEWVFIDDNLHSCTIKFAIRFSLTSPILESILNPVIKKISQQTINFFVKRAKEIY